jgi:GNAT superfamily N-acetyltransferase
MQIRRARAFEAAALSSLAREAKQRWGYASTDMERWREQLVVNPDDITTNPTFVAEVDDKVVGFYLLVPKSTCWELDHLWVAPRVQRHGIGRALLAHAVDTAHRGGATSIIVDADPNAEPFYIACGAIRQAVVAAPIPSDPGRIRPQLLLHAVVDAD